MIKQRCEELEGYEIEKFNKERNEKIKVKTDHLAHRHLLERNSQKQKFDAEYELLEKQKGEMLNTAFSKFKNRRLDLEIQQKSEKNLNENDNMLKASTDKNDYIRKYCHHCQIVNYSKKF